MENLSIEIKFAQNLAGNETKTRLKALKKLKKYLRAKSASKKDGFSSEDLLKLWKGLHYCMWMQDKPLLQEELSTTLTQLVHDLSTEDAQMVFIKVFFITEAREWNSIDIWRLDKFMMMVRNMLYESFVVLKKLKWESKLLDQLMQIFSETVMNPDSDSIPDGLKIHFSDIYLEEVEKIGDGHLTGAQLLKLLDPFVKFMQKAKNMTLLKRVKSRVFEPVITRLADEVKLKKADSSTSDESKEQDDVPLRSLKFDGKLISDHLFQVGQEDCVLGRNRPVMYELVKKIKDIQEGVLPERREIVVSEGITHKDIQTAVNDLIKFDGNKNRKKKLKKKKNKQAKQNGVNENADPNNNRSTDQNPEASQGPSIPQTGEKRKHSFLEDDTDVSMTKIKKKKQEAENTGTEKKTLKKLMNKFSKLDVKKGKKDKKSEIIKNVKAASPQSKKKLKSSDCVQPATHTEAFKESLNSPLTPFNPSKKPESGILKSPAPESMLATSSKGQGSAMATRSTGHITVSQQTPVTRQSVKQIAGKKVSHVVTPVVSLGFEKKKTTPAKRHRAADFFL